jgi:lipopolysaccharide export LptBFGC system permease protein LptF
MLQENKTQEEVYIEKTVTEDGRKKEKHIKEEKVGEELYKVIEVFEEMPLKLKTKIIEKTKSFDLVYEREIVTYNSETGEIVETTTEQVDLPELKVLQKQKNVVQEDSKNTPEKSEIKNLIKNIENNSKTKINTKNLLDKVLLAVVIAQVCYLLYYFVK